MARRSHVLAPLVVAVAVALAVTGCRFGADEPDEPDPAVFCEDHATIDANFASLPNDTLAALRDGVARLAEDTEGLAGRAPDDIAEETEALAAGLRQASDAVAEAPTLEVARAEVAAVVDEGAYQRASAAVDTWVADNCASG
ncbi:MAG TPA: hypothetical protein VEW93_10250 [Acidimicrobiales bacterium]|nr:hypothetical protein [Acidimicrobiales bacterium]